MSIKWEELKNEMGPERTARVEKQAKEMLAELQRQGPLHKRPHSLRLTVSIGDLLSGLESTSYDDILRGMASEAEDLARTAPVYGHVARVLQNAADHVMHLLENPEDPTFHVANALGETPVLESN
jgi:hypothetical protein